MKKRPGLAVSAKVWRETRPYLLLYLVLKFVLLGLALLYWEEARLILVDKGKTFEFLAPTHGLKKFFQDASSKAEIVAFAAYIGVQQFFKGVNIVGVACAVLIGCGTIAKERERGTFELLASRAIGRGRLLWSITWVLALQITVPIFVSSLLVVPLGRAMGYELPWHGLWMAATHASLFVLIFLMLTILCSVLLRTQVQVATAIGAFTIFQVGIFFVPGIRQASLFKLSDYEVYRFMVPGNEPLLPLLSGSWIWMALGILATWFLAWGLFSKRDLA